jgi:hypothetical protein
MTDSTTLFVTSTDRETETVTQTVLATAAAAGPVGTVPQFGQCGGQSYTGPTACAPPYACVSYGPYFSQCQ